MDKQVMMEVADNLEAIVAEIDDGELDGSQVGRAFLAGAMEALRSAAE